MKKFMPIFVCLGLMVVMITVFQFNKTSWNNQLSAQSTEIMDLKNQIQVKKSAITNAQNTLVQETTGLNSARVAKDNESAETFLSYAMTWDSYSEYTQIRNDLMSKYELTEDSSFMKIFMPVVANKVSPDGKNYNRIDTMGLNVMFENMHSYVTFVSPNKYSYFTFVTWSSTSDDGKGKATSTAIFMYDMDADHNISNLDAMVVNNNS